jgi:hypothetical protein
VRGRIPNVKGADAAAERLASTPEFQSARVVKVNPDAPQRGVRFRALKAGRLLLMPTPRLREGFLLLDPATIPPNRLFAASSISGAFSLARPVGLNELPRIDLLVFGSVAASTMSSSSTRSHASRSTFASTSSAHRPERSERVDGAAARPVFYGTTCRRSAAPRCRFCRSSFAHEPIIDSRLTQDYKGIGAPNR